MNTTVDHLEISDKEVGPSSLLNIVRMKMQNQVFFAKAVLNHANQYNADYTIFLVEHLMTYKLL